ncbi:XTP/dITP diphosphatase [Desulfuromonas sp. AOP6]|uniref:XTP/dITP diphosphatase n=1 Tax=Desulfuromonas sp. AOP6 TaxID=1566351 RepID=UPI001282C362|nr:XTP/dITP diphosphatase [Desulfuromonas sp. AOP6]BCA79889.1 non-canonical purine NTP pyrophosphatase [Desulfuromonas sp. AOP6]
MDLVIATRNQGKLKEIRRLLLDTGVVVRGLDEFPEAPEVEEDGDSFEANARKKAETVAAAIGLWTLADDSGLTVEALGGKPGVHSARYAGPAASDADNNAKLIQELTEVPLPQRKGAFNCCMALSRPGEPTRVFHGRIEGLLLNEPRGEGGFGYDPLFLVREYGKTMAELAIEVKNRISHRGQALRQALGWIKDNLLG